MYFTKSKLVLFCQWPESIVAVICLVIIKDKPISRQQINSNEILENRHLYCDPSRKIRSQYICSLAHTLLRRLKKKQMQKPSPDKNKCLDTSQTKTVCLEQTSNRHLNFLYCKINRSGCSMYCFHSLENPAMVTPSMTR